MLSEGGWGEGREVGARSGDAAKRLRQHPGAETAAACLQQLGQRQASLVVFDHHAAHACRRMVAGVRMWDEWGWEQRRARPQEVCACCECAHCVRVVMPAPYRGWSRSGRRCSCPPGTAQSRAPCSRGVRHRRQPSMQHCIPQRRHVSVPRARPAPACHQRHPTPVLFNLNTHASSLAPT